MIYMSARACPSTEYIFFFLQDEQEPGLVVGRYVFEKKKKTPRPLIRFLYYSLNVPPIRLAQLLLRVLCARQRRPLVSPQNITKFKKYLFIIDW